MVTSLGVPLLDGVSFSATLPALIFQELDIVFLKRKRRFQLDNAFCEGLDGISMCGVTGDDVAHEKYSLISAAPSALFGRRGSEAPKKGHRKVQVSGRKDAANLPLVAPWFFLGASRRS